MLLKIAGCDVEIFGDSEDSYFNDAAQHVAGLRDLIDQTSRLPDDGVIFDVGANIGLSSIAMTLAKPSARIFSFEASPINVGYLKKNVAKYKNIEVIPKALSDVAGELRFHESNFAAGSHVISGSHIAQEFPTVLVEALTLDAFAEIRGLCPNLIKIDVEGHEPEVLAGARTTLQRMERPCVVMEFNSWTLNAFAGHSPAAFAAALFKVFDVEGYNHPLTFLHANLVEHHCVTDVVLRLKPGSIVPSLEEMSFPLAALERLRQQPA